MNEKDNSHSSKEDNWETAENWDTAEKKMEKTELIEYLEIPETPFKGVKTDGEYFLVIGNNRLNETKLESWEDVKKDAERTDWFRLMQIMEVITRRMINEIKEQNEA